MIGLLFPPNDWPPSFHLQIGSYAARRKHFPGANLTPRSPQARDKASEALDPPAALLASQLARALQGSRIERLDIATSSRTGATQGPRAS